MTGLVGCDLEYPVRTSDGNYIPAGLLPIRGRKGFPEHIETGGVEVDCCAVELTMKPCANKTEFADTILTHLNAVRDKYKTYGDLVAVSSVIFTKDALKKAPYANEMGCHPDLNVWSGMENPSPNPRGTGLRTFGGHIHIEHGTPATIKACDLTLGMWSVIEDQDRERKKLYGKAGAYRKKDYGVEYRVLSNFWCADRYKIERVWDLVETARELVHDIDELIAVCGGPDEIQAIINKSQTLKARFILKTIGV